MKHLSRAGLVLLATRSLFLAACGDAENTDSPGGHCGNGLIEVGEACDGSELGGHGCTSVPAGFTSGELRCSVTCAFDTSRCTAGNVACGNGVREGTEQCDGDDVGTATCATLVGPSYSGDLACGASCTLDASTCTPPPGCGDGALDEGEQCDLDQLGGATCASVLGVAGSHGDLGCNDNCTIDTSACTLETTCGDGVRSGTEQCDGSDLGTATCATVAGEGYAGDLACEPSTCLFDTTDCTRGGICAPAPTSDLVVDVMDTGAAGDGATDDTAAIQEAVDRVEGTGGTVLVPDGTYMVDALTSVSLGSGMTFRMSERAVLQALPNGEDGYAILLLESVSDVNVVGGTLRGERDEHRGDSGEWGMGLWLNDAVRVVVEDVIARDCWGDGFYVDYDTTDAAFCSVVADNNRRQGMSICGGHGIIIQDSLFTNTNGTAPEAGIDIEPYDGHVVEDVQILRSQFLENNNWGIQVYLDSYSIIDVVMDGNEVIDNRGGGIAIAFTDGHWVINNTIVDGWAGVYLRETTGNVITGNTITAGEPIVGDDGGNTISDNTFL